MKSKTYVSKTNILNLIICVILSLTLLLGSTYAAFSSSARVTGTITFYGEIVVEVAPEQTQGTASDYGDTFNYSLKPDYDTTYQGVVNGNQTVNFYKCGYDKYDDKNGSSQTLTDIYYKLSGQGQAYRAIDFELSHESTTAISDDEWNVFPLFTKPNSTGYSYYNISPNSSDLSSIMSYSYGNNISLSSSMASLLFLLSSNLNSQQSGQTKHYVIPIGLATNNSTYILFVQHVDVIKNGTTYTINKVYKKTVESKDIYSTRYSAYYVNINSNVITGFSQTAELNNTGDVTKLSDMLAGLGFAYEIINGDNATQLSQLVGEVSLTVQYKAGIVQPMIEYNSADFCVIPVN